MLTWAWKLSGGEQIPLVINQKRYWLFLFRPTRRTQPCTSSRSFNVGSRRLLRDLADDYPLSPDLIRSEDFPFSDLYLPRPLAPDDDQRLQKQLCRSDTLEAHALRLMRAAGLRIGECLDLSADCLQWMGDQQAALHVPLGKLHSERWVPVDKETQHIVRRMLAFPALAPGPHRRGRPPSNLEPRPQAFLLPRYRTRRTWDGILRRTLADASRLAECTSRVVPHRLRHTFATEMVRLGVSLPALMQMLGHKDIRMTLRYYLQLVNMCSEVC